MTIPQTPPDDLPEQREPETDVPPGDIPPAGEPEMRAPGADEPPMRMPRDNPDVETEI